MQKVTPQQKPEHRQNTVQSARNGERQVQRVAARSPDFAEASESSPRLQLQGEASRRIQDSQRVKAQRRAFEAFRGGPRSLAQLRTLQTYGAPSVTPLPGRAIQRVEEEEPLQGKFETGRAIQRVEEEEPLQGKFETGRAIQRVEEEEPLQGKFETGRAIQRVEEEEPLQGKFETGRAIQRVEEEEPLQGKFAARPVTQAKEVGQTGSSGLPENLRSGVEALSGMSMAHVNVHYNSAQPAQLNAHAFAQGSEIHVAPGQEHHLPHEAWHVVQQAQGRVQPTMEMQGGVAVNDDKSLEHEADAMGARATSMPAPTVQQQSVRGSSSGPVQRELNPLKAEASRPRHFAVTTNFEPVGPKTPEAGGTTAEITPVPAKPSGDAVVVNPKVDLPPEEKKTLSEKGGAVVGSVTSAGSAASGIKDMVSKFSDTSKITEAASITSTVGGILTGIGAGIVNTITMFVKPLKDAISAFNGMRTKWNQWGAYSAAAKEGIPEAVYGEKKVKHGFVAMVTSFSLAVMDFIANLLMLIPGAQIVGGPMKLFTSIVGIGRSIMNSVIKAFSFFRGNKKEKNSTSLLTNAMKDGPNNKSANLVFNLGLGAFKASFHRYIDKISAGVQKFKAGATNWITGSGWNAPPTYLEKNGEPANAEEMRVGLIGLKKEGGEEALAPIKEEIKQSMTGLTAEA